MNISTTRVATAIVLILSLILIPNIMSYGHDMPGGAHGITANPTSVSYKNQLYVFYQGRKENKKLEYKTYKDGEWSLQERAPDHVSLRGGIGAVVYMDKIFIFHQDRNDNGEMWYTTFDGKKWANEIRLPKSGLRGAPSPVIYNGKLYVFYKKNDSKKGLRYSIFDGKTWVENQVVPNSHLYASPSAVVYNNKLFVFQMSSNDNKDLRYNVFDGKSWTDLNVVKGVNITGAPAATIHDNKIYIFYKNNGSNHLYVAKYNGSTFEVVQMPYARTSESPAAIQFNDQLYVFYQYKEKKGYLWHIHKKAGKWYKPSPTVGFNMEEEGLLDKKFGTFTIPATHNSFIAPPMFINGNLSHTEEVPYQLRQGIRFIELDINKVSFPWNTNMEWNTAIVHGSVWGGSAFGQRKVKNGIYEIRDFLKEYPNEIIILKIDSPSKVSNNTLNHFFKKYGIYDKIYMDKSKAITDLTPRDILKTGKQILIIGHNVDDMACGLEELFNYSSSWGGDYPIASNQDKIGKPFYVPVMYKTEGPLGFGSPSNSKRMNEYNFVKDYLLRGWRTSAMRPFSLIFDFSTYGDVLEVIHELNHHYNAVKGNAVDNNGKSISGVKYKVSYSSDGKSYEVVMNSPFNFPAKEGETITITPKKEGIDFSPASFTYQNASGEDTEVTFNISASNTKSSTMKQSGDDAIDPSFDFNIRLFPNPVDEVVHIDLLMPTTNHLRFEVYDLSGQALVIEDMGILEEGKQSIDYNANRLSKGLYLYRCVVGQNQFTGKFIKK